MKRALFFILLAASFAFAAPVPKALKAKLPDRERILGEWTFVLSERDGKAQPSDAPSVWTFTEGKMHSTSGNTEWVIKLDPDANPKRIDIANYAGIYEFEGDKLKIAFHLNGKAPSELNSKGGAYYYEMVKVSK